MASHVVTHGDLLAFAPSTKRPFLFRIEIPQHFFAWGFGRFTMNPLQILSSLSLPVDPQVSTGRDVLRLDSFCGVGSIV